MTAVSVVSIGHLVRVARLSDSRCTVFPHQNHQNLTVFKMVLLQNETEKQSKELLYTLNGEFIFSQMRPKPFLYSILMGTT